MSEDKTHELRKVSGKIWRYMDFTKFVSMLDSVSLYFARADLLGDPFEGVYTKLDYEIFSARNLSGREAYPFGKRDFMSCSDYRLDLSRAVRHNCFVNCWHLNKCESAAMWRLYLKSDEGIAVQSTTERLVDSLCGGEVKVAFGEVKYIDYESERTDGEDWISPLFYKRSSFAHERELRAVVSARTPFPEVSGVRIPVKLGRLIEAVYVAPTAPPWFHELTGSIARKYGLEIEVRQSSLSVSPII